MWARELTGSGLPRVLGTAAAVLVLGAWWAAPAAADEWTPVDCDQNPNQPGCEVTAENPGEPGWESTQDGQVICRWDGQQVPCTNDWGWFNDGCYYRQLEDQPPPSGAETPGAAYVPQCIGDPPNLRRPAEWIPDSQSPGPELLAQIAVSRLAPPAPRIELSPPPPAPQLVMLPMWLWISEQTWGPRSATASVPGLSVTATATPTEVVWSTGDGGRVVCEGRGTPWRSNMDPAAESPTCGYTYTSTSLTRPGGTYQLSAAVTWQVSWSGGGVSGTVDPLVTTSAVDVAVVESRTVNTGSRR